jgi:hypothetical protein
LIELQGLARRIVILLPDADLAHRRGHRDGRHRCGRDRCGPAHQAFDGLARVVCEPVIEPLADALPLPIHTEWAMLTSGTTGVPKMVRHDFATLSSALVAACLADGADVWGTFYDIRR